MEQSDLIKIMNTVKEATSKVYAPSAGHENSEFQALIIAGIIQAEAMEKQAHAIQEVANQLRTKLR